MDHGDGAAPLLECAMKRLLRSHVTVSLLQYSTVRLLPSALQSQKRAIDIKHFSLGYPCPRVQTDTVGKT